MLGPPRHRKQNLPCSLGTALARTAPSAVHSQPGLSISSNGSYEDWVVRTSEATATMLCIMDLKVDDPDPTREHQTV